MPIEECSICLSIITPSNRTLLTSCDHCFHNTCLDTWKETGSRTCPLCRGSLKTKKDFYTMTNILPLPWVFLVRRIDTDIPVWFYPTTTELFMDMKRWCPKDSLNGNAFALVEMAVTSIIGQ